MNKKIISWNVNGLTSIIKNGFEEVIEKLAPDFVCLQEIKITNEMKELKLGEYNKYYNFSKKGGYAGVAIFAKQKAEKIIYGMPITNEYDEIENVDKESRVITLEYNDFYLVSVYVPCKSRLTDKKNDREKFDSNFNQFIENLNSKKDVIVCGDFNICHKNIDICDLKDNRKILPFTNANKTSFENLLELGLVDTYRYMHPQMRKYTFWSCDVQDRVNENKGWRLDYILVSEYIKKNIREANILSNILGSDHCPIELVIKL